MSTHPISFRTTSELQSQLDKLADATDRPKSWHLEQALRNYLEVQLWQIEHIREGKAEADSGELISHERAHAEMRRWMKKRRAGTRARR